MNGSARLLFPSLDSSGSLRVPIFAQAISKLKVVPTADICCGVGVEQVDAQSLV